MKKNYFFRKLLPLFLLIFIATSCRKESILPSDQQSLELSKSQPMQYYTARNEKLPFYYEGINGEAHTSPSSRRTDYPNCGTDYDDNESVTYTGSYVNYDCGGTGAATITMYWTFVVPANTVPSVGTNTRIRYRFSTSDPYSYSTTVSIGLISSYTNPSTGLPVKAYSFSGTFPLPTGTFCMKNAYYGSIYKLATDCSDIPELTKPVVVDYLTPNTYEVLTLLPFDNTSIAKTFTVWILSTTCFNCHAPALGVSPEYIIRYRLTGTTGWTYYGINQSYSTPAINITVPANGTYEYEYCGKLTAGGTFTPYKVPYPNTFTVLRNRCIQKELPQWSGSSLKYNTTLAFHTLCTNRSECTMKIYYNSFQSV